MIRGFVWVGLLACATVAQASTMTVMGSMDGRIWYDGKDVGTIPLRLTQVPAGRHVVRVLTKTGVDRTFDLNYPKGTSVDRVVDMDVELSRREPAQPVLPAIRPYQDDVRYEYVYPSSSDYYRNYDSRDYRSNYGSYPYGYNQPYYGGGSYGYGGYPGYYDNYGGIYNSFGSNFSRGFRNRDRDSQRSFSTAPAFSSPSSGFSSTPSFQGPAGTPTFSQPSTFTGGTQPFPSGTATSPQPGTITGGTQPFPTGTRPKRPGEP